MKSRAERALEELASIIREGREVSPRKYRKLVRIAGLETTEHLRQQEDDREVGTLRGAIDWIDGVPAFLFDEKDSR